MRKSSEKAMLILKEIIGRPSVKRYCYSEGEGEGYQCPSYCASEQHADFYFYFFMAGSMGGGRRGSTGIACCSSNGSSYIHFCCPVELGADQFRAGYCVGND
jgi:hypothetical protein